MALSNDELIRPRGNRINHMVRFHDSMKVKPTLRSLNPNAGHKSEVPVFAPNCQLSLKLWDVGYLG